MSYNSDQDAVPTGKVLLTDAQLCERWHCTEMTLWRKRQSGKLKRPIKIGGVGKNLTPLEHAEEAERA